MPVTYKDIDDLVQRQQPTGAEKVPVSDAEYITVQQVADLAPVPTQLSQLSGDTTHRTVTDTQISDWNAKYDKPTDGIPASDLAAGVIPDVSGKADKVAGATAGNLAGLDASGDITDSGSKPADFATAAQGAKADTAYQKPSGGIPASDLEAGVIPTVPVQDVTLSGASVVTAGVAVLPAYPTTLPASDVYAWAKAATKPSYDYSEIAGTPIDYTDAELQTAIDTAFANI